MLLYSQARCVAVLTLWENVGQLHFIEDGASGKVNDLLNIWLRSEVSLNQRILGNQVCRLPPCLPSHLPPLLLVQSRCYNELFPHSVPVLHLILVKRPRTDVPVLWCSCDFYLCHWYFGSLEDCSIVAGRHFSCDEMSTPKQFPVVV